MLIIIIKPIFQSLSYIMEISMTYSTEIDTISIQVPVVVWKNSKACFYIVPEPGNYVQFALKIIFLQKRNII